MVRQSVGVVTESVKSVTQAVSSISHFVRLAESVCQEPVTLSVFSVNQSVSRSVRIQSVNSGRSVSMSVRSDSQSRVSQSDQSVKS